MFHSPKPTIEDKENEALTSFHSPCEQPEEGLYSRHRTPPPVNVAVFENPLSTPRRELPDYDPDAISLSSSESVSPDQWQTNEVLHGTCQRQSESCRQQHSPFSDFSDDGAVWSRLPVSSLPWDPDESQHACTSCKDVFSVFRRRHHCRKCGGLFCSTCSNRVLTNVRGYKHPVRSCEECFSKEQWKSRKAGSTEFTEPVPRTTFVEESCRNPCVVQ